MPSMKEDGGQSDGSERSAVRSSSDASVPAIVATLALVAFSVFIGVYGPRLGNRQQLPGGTTLVELASFLRSKHATETIGTIELLRDEPAEVAALERDLAEILGRKISLPDVEGRSVTWLRIARVRAPGATGAQVLFRVGPRANAEFASLFILRDEDRFTTFDSFGRPRAMPEGEMFSVEISSDAPNTVLHLFRSGSLVYGVESGNREIADQVAAELQSIAAEAEAVPGSRPEESASAPGAPGPVETAIEPSSSTREPRP